MALATAFDYSLTGPEAERASEMGLVEADWYQSPISPDVLADLTTRTNARAMADAFFWVALLVGAGVVLWSVRSSWWAIPVFAVYATLYGGSADARWHEFGHGTATRSDLFNNLVYYPACFMLLREPTVWRWSHFRHHSDTIVRGRDAEIVFPRPFNRRAWLGNLIGLFGVPTMFKRIVKHAGGTVGEAEQGYIPVSEHRKVVIEARVFLFLLGVVIAIALGTQSIIPLLFVGLPTFFGSWLVLFFGTTQHAGLPENVLDHRVITRTVTMNPVFRFLYLNMNYHVEHHMFPSVPYRNLPKLHEAIKEDLPAPCPSTLAAYREIFEAVQGQQHDASFEVERHIPTSANVQDESSKYIAMADADNWVAVCASSELGTGQLRRVDVGEETFVLVRVLDGSLHVTDGICTHSRRVHLAEGVIVGGDIECPKHNGRFDLSTGAATREPACDALQAYKVNERDGRISFQIEGSS